MSTSLHPVKIGKSGFLALALSSNARGVTLPAAAAIIGLIAGGFSLFKPAPKTTAIPAGVAAMVNQRPILLSDFINEVETESSGSYDQATTAQRTKALSSMIDQELLVQRALALDLPETTDEVRTALADGLNAQIAAPALGITPTEDQLRAYYLAHRSSYASEGSMAVHDIVLKVGGYQNTDQSFGQAEADAEEAVYKLRSGQPLAGIMDHYNFANSGRVTGTEFDFAAKIHLGPKLYPVAHGMNDGDVSDPVELDDGVHVLVMDHRIAPHYSTYEAVRAQVFNGYRDMLRTKAQTDNVSYLRANAKILLAPGLAE